MIEHLRHCGLIFKWRSSWIYFVEISSGGDLWKSLIPSRGWTILIPLKIFKRTRICISFIATNLYTFLMLDIVRECYLIKCIPHWKLFLHKKFRTERSNLLKKFICCALCSFDFPSNTYKIHAHNLTTNIHQIFQSSRTSFFTKNLERTILCIKKSFSFCAKTIFYFWICCFSH